MFEKRAIGELDANGNPLLVRYVVFRVPSFGVFLHKLCRSDYDRALHDHPWGFVSIILRGGYDEVMDTETLTHKPGVMLFRPAQWRHRVVIATGRPAWTLVLVGRRQRRWGFWTKTGWCWWRKYNYAYGICEEEPIWEGGED